MIIRKMEEKDINTVYDIWKQVKEFQVSDNEEWFWWKDILQSWVTSIHDVLLIAELNNAIIWFSLTSIHKPTKKATLENIWVDIEKRGNGVAEKLLYETLKMVKEEGITYICAMSEPRHNAIISLFKKHHFDSGHNFTWMWKFLWE